MPNAEKVKRVAALKARIEGSSALLLTEYRGLTVSEISELRRSLAEGGARFAVVKNTLMRRAANDAGLTELDDLLLGPSAITFVDGDPVAAAKSVVKLQKLYPALVLKGAWLEGRLLSADEAKSLADLESREAMLSKVAGLMKADMTKAAALFVSAQSKFLGVLEALKAKLPAPEEPEAVAEPEGVAVTEPEPEPEEVEAAAEPEAEAAPEPEAAAEPESVSDEAESSDQQQQEE
jgi:large subunit ribosomal protein L10